MGPNPVSLRFSLFSCCLLPAPIIGLQYSIDRFLNPEDRLLRWSDFTSTFPDNNWWANSFFWSVCRPPPLVPSWAGNYVFLAHSSQPISTWFPLIFSSHLAALRGGNSRMQAIPSSRPRQPRIPSLLRPLCPVPLRTVHPSFCSSLALLLAFQDFGGLHYPFIYSPTHPTPSYWCAGHCHLNSQW